jgi:broad specificity phosphatase PhoE
MLVYAIRHAESLANVQLEDGRDSALSPLGRQQAEALTGRFGNLAIAAIYSSPFLRSIETALPIAKRLNLPIRIRPELCEFQDLPAGAQADLGLEPISKTLTPTLSLEGRGGYRDRLLGDVAAIARRHPEVIPCPDCRLAFTWPPPDESLAAMIARVRAFVVHLKDRWRSPEDTIILTGHGSPTARLIEAWLTDQPGPAFRFTIDNAAVAALRYAEGVSSLVCLNEISHLRGLAPAHGANYRDDGSIKPAPRISYW